MQVMANSKNIQIVAIRKHLLAGAAAAGIGVLGVCAWAATAELAGAVVASGVVVVDSNVKKIQHPLGGIVKELLVRNGDFVKAGQVIVRLDDTQARSTLAIHIKRNDELLARQARHEAELAGADRIAFPQQLTSQSANPDIALLLAAQNRMFTIQREAHEGQRAQLRERISQLGQKIVGLEAQATAKGVEIEWIRKELEGITSLWEKNLVQFGRVVALQRDLARAEGDSGQLAAAQAESKNKIAETELQILQIDEDFRSEVGKELATLRADLDICTQRKIAAEDVFSRIEIRAPQDGTVHEMSVHTVGGVVASGEELLQIVPANDTLDVWAKVPPESVDQVHVGQTAVLRFPAFDPRSTPEIDATVAIVSADLIHDDKTDERYYSARIAVPPQRLQELGLRLLPGMPVEAFIRTEDRTVVSYLMKPLNDQINKAFRER
jgi:HlyD family secretion protein